MVLVIKTIEVHNGWAAFIAQGIDSSYYDDFGIVDNDLIFSLKTINFEGMNSNALINVMKFLKFSTVKII